MREGLEKTMTIIHHSSLLIIILVSLLTGCGQSSESTVRGTVTFDGKPLSTGMVAFHSPKDGGATSYGQILANGSYEIRTGKRLGLVAGEYVATVVATEPMTPKLAAGMEKPKQITPARYANTTTTDLRCTVKPGANNIDFALKP